MGLVVCTLVTEAMDGEELAGKVSSYIEKRFRALIRNAQRREGA